MRATLWYGRRVTHPDLNLLAVLDALLAEGSVTRAARRLRLSPSAMSRALARVRAATGDPLLVRSGRALVPTPRATELRASVSVLVRDAEAVLTPRAAPDLRRLSRTFALRASDGFVETFGLALLERLREEAPAVRLRFVQKPDKDGAHVREGSVDLETAVVDATVFPELRTQALFEDRLIGVVSAEHALSKGKMTAARYAASSHVTVSRPMLERGPIDAALETLGLRRESSVVVGGFASAIAIARTSDLVATVPERHTEGLRVGVHAFALPLSTPGFTVSMIWHPKLDADPVQRWLRACVREVCGRDRRRPVRRAASR